jgi:hypothetical protein
MKLGFKLDYYSGLFIAICVICVITLLSGRDSYSVGVLFAQLSILIIVIYVLESILKPKNQKEEVKANK